jgi:hypothetical protein
MLLSGKVDGISMDKTSATNWAIHHMVVDYYHKLLSSVRRNIQIPGLKFEDFLPKAQERVEALLPTILDENLPCGKEAKKILSWKCREHAEIEVISKVQALNRETNSE